MLESSLLDNASCAHLACQSSLHNTYVIALTLTLTTKFSHFLLGPLRLKEDRIHVFLLPFWPCLSSLPFQPMFQLAQVCPTNQRIYSNKHLFLNSVSRVGRQVHSYGVIFRFQSVLHHRCLLFSQCYFFNRRHSFRWCLLFSLQHFSAGVSSPLSVLELGVFVVDCGVSLCFGSRFTIGTTSCSSSI